MQKNPCPKRRVFSRTQLRRLLTPVAFMIPMAAHAADVFKANNADALNLTSSWTSGAVPTEADVAVFDATVTNVPPDGSTGFRYMLLPSATSWRGIRVNNAIDGLAIDSFGQGLPALTIGSAGIDLSAAASGTTFQMFGQALTIGASQTWKVADGATLDITNGTLTRGAGAIVNIELGTNGTGVVKPNAMFGTANTVLSYVTIANSDFAAVNADQTKLVAAATLAGVYTPNPNTGTANPNMSGTFGAVDVVNSNTNFNSAFRASNTLTVGSTRFATAHTAGQDWVVDVNTRNVNMGGTTVLVSPLLGTQKVIYNGTTGNVRLGTGSTLTLIQNNTNAAGDLIFNAQITQPAGAGASLVKYGSGRVVLAHDGNNYAGNTTINTGTLQIGNGGATGFINAASAVVNNGTLAFNRTNDFTFANVISGSGGLTQAGSGEVNLSGANTFTGPVQLQAGSLAFTSLDNLGGVANTSPITFGGGALKWNAGNTIDISSGKSLVFSSGVAGFNTNGQDITLGSVIGGSGAGGLSKRGAGTLTLQGANTYQGATTVQAGTLAVANSSGSATGLGPVTVQDTSKLAGTGSLTGIVTVNSGGTVAPGIAGVGTLTLGGLSLSAGSIIDAEVASTSSYDRIVTTSNNGLTVNGGGVRLYNAGGTLPLSTPGTYNLIQFAGSIQGAGATSLSVLNPQAGYAYTFGASSNNLTLLVEQDAILTKWNPTGGGTWGSAGNWSTGVPAAGYTAQFTTALAAPSTITLDGNRTINGAVFQSANGYTIAQGTSGTLTIDRGAKTAAINVALGDHTISAPVSLVSGIAVSTEAASGLTLSGAVSGAGGVIKTGPGYLDFTGNNSFSGSINVFEGRIGFGQASSLGSGAITLDGGTVRYGVGNNADLTVRITDSAARSITLGEDGGTIDTNGNDVIWMNPVGNGGAGSLTKTGAGILALDATNTYSGGTIVTGGTLRIASDTALGTAGSQLTLNGGKLSVGAITLGTGATNRPLAVGASGGSLLLDSGSTFTLPGVFSGAGVLTTEGTGTVVFPSNTATNTGGIIANGGTINMDLLAGKTPVSGEVVTVNTTAALGTGTLTFNGGTLTSTVIDANALALGNAINIPAGQTGTIVSPNRFQLIGAASGAGTLNLHVRSTVTRADLMNNFAVAGNLFTGTVNLINDLAGSAATNVRLMINNTPSFNGAGLAGATLNVGNGITIITRTNSGGNTVQIGKLSGGLGGALTSEAGGAITYQIGALNSDSVYYGNLSPSAANSTITNLTKVGTGSLTLAGNNTSTGAYVVSGGSLILNGLSNTVTGTTVDAAGILGGNGSLSGSVLVNGTLQPDVTGTLGEQLDLVAGSSLTLAGTTQFDFAGTTFTGVKSLGSVAYGGALKLNFTGVVYSKTYQLFELSSAASGAFNTVSATSGGITTDLIFNSNTGAWEGSTGSAGLSFNPTTGVLTVTGGAIAVLPAVPAGLAATSGNAQVVLNWNAAANASSYIVKRSTTPGGPYTNLSPEVVTTTKTDTGLTNGTTYYYVVQAKNSAGLSANSTEVSATPVAAPVHTALETWRFDQFGVYTDDGTVLAGDLEDFDGDGLVNLQEYALGTNPKVANASPVVVGRNGDKLTLTYPRIADAKLSYTVQGRNDLVTGSWATVDVKTGNAAGSTVVEDTALISANPRRFLRLSVTYTP